MPASTFGVAMSRLMVTSSDTVHPLVDPWRLQYKHRQQ